jgi:hypothetical protein
LDLSQFLFLSFSINQQKMVHTAEEIENAKTMVATLLDQEQKLQFTKFTSQDALALGLNILDKVKTEYGNRPIAVDITVNGLILFRHAMDGASPDNEAWIRRKRYQDIGNWMMFILNPLLLFSVTRSIDSITPVSGWVIPSSSRTSP